MPKNIVLISCGSKKGKTKAPAKDLYLSPLFTNSLAYARALKPGAIYILSALHGLLDPDHEIEPYNVTLSSVSPAKRAKKPDLIVLTRKEANDWGQRTITQLEEVSDLQNDTFIVLAGQDYIKPIVQQVSLKMVEPLKGLRMGERTAELQKRTQQLYDHVPA